MEKMRENLVGSLAELGRAMGDGIDRISGQEVAAASKNAQSRPLLEAATWASQLAEREVKMAERRLHSAKAVIKAARRAEAQVAAAKAAAARAAAEAKAEEEKAAAAIAAAKRAADKASSAAQLVAVRNPGRTVSWRET